MVREQVRLTLDKVEKKLLKEIQVAVPEYSTFELDIIAHDQLKKRLFAIRKTVQERMKQAKKNLSENSDKPIRTTDTQFHLNNFGYGVEESTSPFCLWVGTAIKQ